MDKDVALISFSRTALLRCRQLAPEIMRGHLFYQAGIGDVIEGAREIASELVMPFKGMLSVELRDRAREAGLKVATWVVDEPDELKTLARYDLYGIGSNRPGVLLDAIREVELAPPQGPAR
jgi:glycerophosphoryl diester phosphodiesterase